MKIPKLTRIVKQTYKAIEEFNKAEEKRHRTENAISCECCHSKPGVFAHSSADFYPRKEFVVTVCEDCHKTATPPPRCDLCRKHAIIGTVLPIALGKCRVCGRSFCQHCGNMAKGECCECVII